MYTTPSKIQYVDNQLIAFLGDGMQQICFKDKSIPKNLKAPHNVEGF